MSKCLVEELNPNGNLLATVMEECGSCYLYLTGNEDSTFGTRAVWVRNLVPAPSRWDKSAMTRGEPPLNAAPHCRYPEGQSVLKPDQLKLVWLPEGNGVALYEADALLAIIPPWSGIKGFDGYSRDAKGDGLVAWELTPDNILNQRFADAKRYWDEWEKGTEWRRIQESMLKKVHITLGVESNYYAIDGDNWPPKALLRIPRKDCVVLVTIGVSIRPQPNVEMNSDEPELLRRMEMGVVLPSHWPDSKINEFGDFISSVCDYPWDEYSWLGHHHTISCGAWNNRKYSHAVLTRIQPHAPTLVFEKQYGDPVNILWCIPVTKDEEELAVEKGTAQLIKSLPATRWCDA